MVLRLSRDFQRRGPLLQQFFSLAIVGMAMLEDEPVVYSVANDGEDDGAQLDWKFGSGGQVKGDWIFRLPPVVK